MAAVNKMDLVDYSREVFEAIRDDFSKLAERLDLRSKELIPVSALAGDNVVEPSTAMPWYSGPTLLDYLETVPLALAETAGPLRFPVQLVVRPNAKFRGFAGRVERGELRPGLAVRALPSRRTTRVGSLISYDGALHSARAPQSVTVVLEDEIDLSRGEMLIGAEGAEPIIGNRLRAMVVWMHEQPLSVGAVYLLKHTTRTARATVHAIRYRVDINSAEHLSAGEIAMNDIAELELNTNLPLFYDAYAENRSTGSFILIDFLSNATLGAGMLLTPLASEPEDALPVGSTSEAGSVERSPSPSLILLPGDPEGLRAVQLELQNQGRGAVIVDDPLIAQAALPGVVRALQMAKVTALSANNSLGPDLLQALRTIAGNGCIEGHQALTQWRKGR